MPLPEWLIRPMHFAFVWMYILAPVSMAVEGLWQVRRQRDFGRLVTLGMVGMIGLLIGGGLCFVFAMMGDARVIVSQWLLTAYLVTALLLVLRGVDAGVGWLLSRRGNSSRMVVRTALLVCIALPWVMSTAMVYRPRVAPMVTPLVAGGWQFDEVQFPATDGSRVSAWWIPAQRGTRPADDRDWGSRTVILVHGLASNKGNVLPMVQALVPAGFNVLSIDTRGHGLSEGQISTLGIDERFDVLGAVEYLKQNRAAASRHVFGLGVNQGAAALLAAATDESTAGNAIEAVAAYGAFEDADSLMTQVAQEHFPGPVGWLLRKVGFPLAEIHAGAPLRSFNSAARIDHLWPRPLLVIHGRKDAIIPFEQGRRLFRDASQPKEALWLEGTHNGILIDEGAADAVQTFFRHAQALPVI